MKKIFIGYDHGGYDLAQKVKKFLAKKNYEIIDLGCEEPKSCDFPIYGKFVAENITKNPNSLGIVICGSGVGISIAANRVLGAHAVLANTIEIARLGREHNDANILALGGRTKFFDPWEKILETFLNTKKLDNERYTRRRNLLDNLN